MTTKSFKLFKFISQTAVAGTALFLFMLFIGAGCKVDSADSAIYITPSAATVGHKGQSVVLTAHGGYIYYWSLENNTWGTLDTYRGNQVIYTSRHEPTEMQAVQVIKVTSLFSDNEHSGTGGGGGDTNAPPVTSVVHKAEAYIAHLPVTTQGTQ